MKKSALLFVLFLTLLTPKIRANECFFRVDYLFWNVLQSSMSYAVRIEDLSSFTNPVVIVQKQNWASAFRVTGGYLWGCSFDTSFSWTRLHNSVKGSTNRPIIVATELLSPQTNVVIGGEGFGGPASSKWKICFNMFDLHFGRPIFADCLFAIHPYVGVKGGTIFQDQEIVYEHFEDLNNPGNFLDANVNERNNSWAVGPKIGFDSAYRLGCGFSIIGDFSTSFLYGRLFSSARTVSSEPGVPSMDSKLRNTKNRLFPVFQLLVGFNYDTCWCNRPVSLGVGYEIQYFFHTWRIFNSSIQTIFITNTGFGDLMLHGLNVNLTTTF